ncbi:hypothetical protein ASF40_16055 [Microbacterium sp. Leaf288]|nr:hypothetical protein ASF40_16055 [Microbacterium sp. Leaf288]
MIRETVATIDGLEVIALDSASQIELGDRRRLVIAASNGGRESGRAAVLAGCAAVVFNDAGIGKDRAGVSGLDLVDAEGIAGMAVAHTSAEISDGLGTWRTGVLSTVNSTAAALGIRPGMPVREAVAIVAAARKEAS